MEQDKDGLVMNFQDFKGPLSGKCPAVEHKMDTPSKASIMTTAYSPSFSDTSSLFSTVDCSSFSSRSDASSFAKEEVSVAVSGLSVSVNSSVELSSRRNQGAKEVGYLEFSILRKQLVDSEHVDSSTVLHRTLDTGSIVEEDGFQEADQNDAFERFPVWTERTRYCSQEVHSRVNPCFEKRGDASVEPRETMSKKLAKSLASVLSKHLASSPGPAFRRSSCERFSSRLTLDNPSPSSEKSYPPTPCRRFGTGCLNSVSESRLSTVSGTDVQKSPRTYDTSPNSRKSLGCLRGSRSPTADYRGPLYFASEDSVHGGINRCLPSPRLSFGNGKGLATFKQDQTEGLSTSTSMVVPSTTVHGQLHCILRGDLPSFNFLVDGLEEVFVAKPMRPGIPCSPDIGEPLYVFYSWKPRGRTRVSWKGWMRRDRAAPDFVGQMSVASKLIPASTKDGQDTLDLEFILRDEIGVCSPRLSFSTWETGSSPMSCRSPMYSPSPFCMPTPSPGRLTSSRYGPMNMQMVPANLTLPQVDRPRFRRSRRPQVSPLRQHRARSDDERSSSFQDAWSDTEAEFMPTKELAALVMRIPTSGNKLWTLESINQRWERAKRPAKALCSSRKSSSYCRKLSLPGRFQETKENVDNTSETYKKDAPSSKTSFKLRELMGIKADFAKQQEPAESTSITVVLPAGNHGVPTQGSKGPEPLVDRWRSGGRCDCGSWDLGCGLTILEGEIKDQQKNSSSSIQQAAETSIEILSQSKSVMSLAMVDDGIASFTFQAPLSYLQAFASAVAILYSRGPCEAATGSSSFRKSAPRYPLRPLGSAHMDHGYCSPPPASLLDRL